MRYTFSQDVPDSTYFRRGDAEPAVKDGALVLYDGHGTRRSSWGAPQVNTTIVVDAEDFLAVLVGFSHKHGGGQFWRYYTVEDGRPAQLAWKDLTDDERQLVLDAYKDKAPAWARKPGKLSADYIKAKPYSKVWFGYKLLRELPDGRLLGFYTGNDGVAEEYVLNQEKKETAKENHGGGYYVHRDPKYLLRLHGRKEAVPDPEDDYKDYKTVLVKCACAGRHVEYSSGKIATSWIRPLYIESTP